jgi:ABC-type transporter Mla subunit MlaD
MMFGIWASKRGLRVSAFAFLLLLPVISCIVVSCYQSRSDLQVRFTRLSGLRVGASVTYRGVVVGAVKDIEVDREGILVTLTLPSKLSLRSADKIEVAVPSLLGDRMIELKPGSSLAPLVQPGRVLQGVDEPTWDITHVAVREIFSAPLEDRERAIEKWRPWFELSGVIGRPSVP